VPWRANLVLFLVTVVSVFATGVWSDRAGQAPITREALVHGAQFAGTLLTILVAHELGHFVAARIHKVDASLPYFIPMPMISPFGTMGAVIRMRGTIPTRAALLDIGASGPLAGLAFAIPLYLWGAAHSHFVSLASVSSDGMVELGESITLKVLDRLAGVQAPDGMELELSPVAFAAWAGMFVTMINLIPVAQLDGGHVAYALFGTRQNKIAKIIHRSMLAFFFVSLAMYTLRDVRAGLGLYRFGTHVGNSIFWLVWFEMLGILGTLARPHREERPAPGTLGVRTRIVATLGLLVVAGVGRDKPSVILWIAWFTGLGMLLAMERRGGALRPSSLLDHPPTGAAPLGVGRAAIAVVTLAFFALLFMPTPISM
jgi:membrane-associated protease RseP (regulator of RpoE activity)